ncbi:sensor histidine kinase [Catalinimonas alkaloidigena]|uniref:sensor histidine kinase n=1 Tax=Catalinimonas alkaloidigena TaxID=1075417 RepID=UPI0015A3CF8B|nr:sensor histidine kinase [Catalinimonas alkaloidigena]
MHAATEIPILTKQPDAPHPEIEISYFEDKKKVFDFEELLAVQDSLPFEQAERGKFNFGFSKSVFWLHLRVKRTADEPIPWLLEVEHPSLDIVDFFYHDTDSTWKEINSGELYSPIYNQPQFYHNYLFPVDLSDTTAQDYFLRIHNKGSVRVSMSFVEASYHQEVAMRQEIIFGIFYGALIGLLLYNLLLFFSLLEWSYLYYCCFVGFNICLQLVINGHAPQYLEFVGGFCNELSVISAYGTLFFSTIFAITFLKTHRHLQGIHVLLQFLAIASGLGMVFAWRADHRVASEVIAFLFVATSASILTAGVHALYQGNKSARYFVLAWAILLIGTFLLGLHYLGWISLSIAPDTIVQVGSFIEALLFAISLADRIRMYRSEKEIAQTEALAAAAEQERIITEYNQQLEETIQLRTDEIIQKSEEIQQQNETLHEQQAIIEEKNRELQQYNYSLEKQVEDRTQQLMRSHQVLVRRNSQLEQFAFMVSHKIRKPVAHILGLMGIIGMEQSPLSVLQKYLPHLEKATHNLDAVIKDLAQLLEIEEAATTDKLQESEFAQVFATGIKPLAGLIGALQAEIHTDFSQVAGMKMIPEYMENIFYHLISNALQYHTPGRRPVIYIQSYVEESGITLTCKDNGVGIDLNTYGEKIFGIYQQLHENPEGKGLGLYLVKMQTEAMNGRINIESCPGQGTTFTLHFEVAVHQPA